MATARNVFISYSRRDKDYCLDLIKYLKPLEKEGLISIWYDGEIAPGLEWNSEIVEHLNKADIVLLLVSVEFINSDYIAKIELERAMQRHETKEARVIPIIIRGAPWEKEPFAKLHVLPEGAKPVNRWDYEEEAYLNIAQGIRKSIGDIKPQGVGALLPAEGVVSILEDRLPEEEYYRLYGLKGLRPGPIVQNFAINRNDALKELNQNPIQYLWADSYFGNSINTCIMKEKKIPHLRVFFDYNGGKWGCNIAIRPQCGMACHNEKRWRYLSFDARIPLDELEKNPDYLRSVGISLRIVNGRFQHWEYALKQGDYFIHQIEEVEWGGELVRIDLEDKSKWHLFPEDGNYTPTARTPDLSVIAGVVLKFGSDPGMPGELGQGKGVIDIRSLNLID